MQLFIKQQFLINKQLLSIIFGVFVGWISILSTPIGILLVGINLRKGNIRRLAAVLGRSLFLFVLGILESGRHLQPTNPQPLLPHYTHLHSRLPPIAPSTLSHLLHATCNSTTIPLQPQLLHPSSSPHQCRFYAHLTRPRPPTTNNSTTLFNHLHPPTHTTPLLQLLRSPPITSSPFRPAPIPPTIPNSSYIYVLRRVGEERGRG